MVPNVIEIGTFGTHDVNADLLINQTIYDQDPRADHIGAAKVHERDCHR
jgi:hypothetical protein